MQRDNFDEIISEINIIPFVDISLVLLIIFMVTANYIMTSSLTINIPQASHAKQIQPNDVVTINVSREGPVYIEKELVTSAELRKRIKAKFQDNHDVAVILSADRNVSFKNVVNILDLLSEIGISRLNIATVNE
ncbi:MAG: biopolymer transporter ExbD [Candidatus Omnitrophota bacterium]|nr:biopolymer transporter ExbD [Candidatus Omnitrophota bacterium]